METYPSGLLRPDSETLGPILPSSCVRRHPVVSRVYVEDLYFLILLYRYQHHLESLLTHLMRVCIQADQVHLGSPARSRRLRSQGTSCQYSEGASNVFWCFICGSKGDIQQRSSSSSWAKSSVTHQPLRMDASISNTLDLGYLPFNLPSIFRTLVCILLKLSIPIRMISITSAKVSVCFFKTIFSSSVDICIDSKVSIAWFHCFRFSSNDEITSADDLNRSSLSPTLVSGGYQ